MSSRSASGSRRPPSRFSRTAAVFADGASRVAAGLVAVLAGRRSFRCARFGGAIRALSPLGMIVVAALQHVLDLAQQVLGQAGLRQESIAPGLGRALRGARERVPRDGDDRNVLR